MKFPSPIRIVIPTRYSAGIFDDAPPHPFGALRQHAGCGTLPSSLCECALRLILVSSLMVACCS